MRYNPNRGRCFTAAEMAAYRARQRIRWLQKQEELKKQRAAQKPRG